MSKAKRIIKEFDFESEGASVHLVSKKQGGAANGFKTLIMKSNSTEHLPDVEEIEIQKKLEQIKVTMSMEEFLRKFFNMYYDDAELLTAMLGFQTEYESYMESNQSEPYDHANYIADKLSGFEVMKSMHEQNFENVSASDVVSILELQEKIEKQLNEEMMDKVSIEKSRLTQLEQAESELATNLELVKSLEAEKVELQTALDEIKKAQADAELENMQARLKGLIAEEKVESMAKSLLALDKESAEDMLEALSVQKKAVEETNLFEEVSNTVENTEKTKEELFEEQLLKSLSK